MVTIAFPGLGIEPFTVNKVAFTIPILGGLEVRWYGIVITVGIVLAFFYAYYRSKQEGIILDDLLDIAIYAVVVAMIGARAYYVIFDIVGNGNAAAYNSFWDYIAIWEGGIAIYGAIIGGALAVFLVSKFKKIKWQKSFDMISPGVMIGQILGRWGNFFNGEAFGGVPAEGSFLYRFRMEVKQDTWYSTVTAHPTFFYESFWNLCGFLIINAFYKKKRFDGEVFLWYITWYGFGRMFIEGLRTDSLYLGSIRISQLVGALCFVVGLALTLIFRIKAVKAGSYPVFAAAKTGGNVPSAPDTAVMSEDENTVSSCSSRLEQEDEAAKGQSENNSDQTEPNGGANTENTENTENAENAEDK